MAQLTLVIGNKNYSSWSLRPWLLLKHLRLPFAEIRVDLFAADAKQEIRRYSPSGRVPLLIDGRVRVWESLAICEYLAERSPPGAVWPQDAGARPLARAISSEMHAGFAALRSEFPMNCRARKTGVEPSTAAQDDIRRICEIWQSCRLMYEAEGPWLFGDFSAADAMFAPVASRFATYGVKLPEVAEDYVRTVHTHPAMQAWLQAAREEAETGPQFERGQPLAEA